MQSRLIAATVLAVSKAVSLEDAFIAEEVVHNDFPKNTDDIIEFLNEELGNIKYTPDKALIGEGTFEHDLNNILGDFYDKTGAEFGAGVYGEFYEHGGYHDLDFDYGLDPHGVPVHEH